MRKWCLEASVILLIAGCSNPNNIQSIKTVYPNIPDVPALPDLQLKPIEFSLPTKESFVALDFANWQNWLGNLQALKQRELLYQQRLKEINLQRKEWRDKS